MLSQQYTQDVENRRALRLSASRLIDEVLEETLEPERALKRWPIFFDDSSLNAAYQILWHFESDEDQQQQEIYYIDAQLELLKQVSVYLSRGEDLPDYMIRPYQNHHPVEYYGYTKRTTWNAPFEKGLKGICFALETIQKSFKSLSDYLAQYSGG